MSQLTDVSWGMHAGATGDADSLFFKENCIAIGWPAMGDLRELTADREAFKARLAETHKDTKPGAIPVSAGQLFRFVHEAKEGDLVIYPRKADRTIHLGRIEGAYDFGPNLNAEYPHQRKVNWLKKLSRNDFSQGALYEIGSPMSFFQVKNYADEYRAALIGEPIAKSPEEDETLGYVAKEIEETTKDFVLKQLARVLKGSSFEKFIGNLFEAMGYHATVTRASVDGGIDVIAHKDELGLVPPIIKIQVKSQEGTVGGPDVKALYAMVDQQEVGLVVTLGGFSKAAEDFAATRSNLRLIDGTKLVDQILRHYDGLDPRYKSIIPLKSVYVPEPIAENEE